MNMLQPCEMFINNEGASLVPIGATNIQNKLQTYPREAVQEKFLLF